MTTISDDGPWKAAVINELITGCILTAEHENDPCKALQDAINWNVQIALDPSVSSEARALMERGAVDIPAQHAAAEATLRNLGYTYHDGELWAPPIGKKPDSDLLDATQVRIANLTARLEKAFGLLTAKDARIAELEAALSARATLAATSGAEPVNVHGPEHLAPKPAEGMEFDAHGVLVPSTSPPTSGAEPAKRGMTGLVDIDPNSRAGKPPCGECHLQPGERCDICGAMAPESPPVVQPEAVALTFTQFREANRTRCLRWHPKGIESWSDSDWITAIVGELGELASLIKMRNRERDGLSGNKFSPTNEQIAKEAADVFTYLDLFCERNGIDLGVSAASKFNEVSERVGFPDRIVLASADARDAAYAQGVRDAERAMREHQCSLRAAIREAEGIDAAAGKERT